MRGAASLSAAPRPVKSRAFGAVFDASFAFGSHESTHIVPAGLRFGRAFPTVGRAGPMNGRTGCPGRPTWSFRTTARLRDGVLGSRA